VITDYYSEMYQGAVALAPVIIASSFLQRHHHRALFYILSATFPYAFPMSRMRNSQETAYVYSLMETDCVFYVFP
jgi:hypothetical protein